MRQDWEWQVGASDMPQFPFLCIGLTVPAHAHCGAVGKIQGAFMAVSLQS